MILVDSHCHLDCLDYANEPEGLLTILERARANAVQHFLCVSIKQSDFAAMQEAVAGYDDVSLSVGTHPTERVENEPTVDSMMPFALLPKVVAIGETGLDYYRVLGDVSWQQDRFRRHIRVALAAKKPLIVHSREAREDTIRILAEENAAKVGGVLHCFTETWEMAQRALELDFYISFSGIVTFKNAQALQEVVKQVPLDRILIETDAPYLAPMPYRGKPNEPAYVLFVAEKIAELKGVSLEEVAAATTRNFFNLFTHAQP